VGVLKVLEEIHVPVDLVAGASMGSIVGGLYATGMTPQEMEDALAAMDWNAAFEDDVPRKELPFRRKFDESSFLTKLTLGIQDGHLAMPTGLVEGQKLNFILRELTLPSALVEDFDRLPIPFRATATDVASGEGVVLRRGNVADAMRASMAFPGLFAPVEIDGRLLVDGGVAENFPVLTARRNGAEVLVAVNIGTPPAGKEKLTSLVKIVNQVTNAATAKNVKESKEALGPRDVFIEPDLGDISFIDFARVRDAVAAGERAARKQVDELRRFSVPEAEYRAWRERTRRKPYTPFVVSSVELVNPSPVADAVVMSHVSTKPGPLDLKRLQADLESISSIGEFDLVDWRLAPREGGNVLQIVIKDRAWGRTSARFGINLAADFKGNSGFELVTSITRTSVNRLGAEWRVIAGVGELTTIDGELFQPLATGSPFFAAGIARWSTDTPEMAVDGDARVDVRRKDYSWGGDVGIGDGKFAEVRVGARLGHLWSDPATSGSFTDESVDRGAVVSRLTVDTRDNVPFPRKGFALRATMGWQTPALGADVTSRRLLAVALGALSAGKNTIQLAATAGSPVKSTLPYYDWFSLGGFRRLSGYTLNELWGPYMAYGSVTYLREIGRFKSTIIGGGMFLGGSLEAGNVWQDGADVSLSRLKVAASAFLGLDSPLGPVYLGYGFAERGKSSVTVSVGVPF
jgi:NTE family protein